VKRQDGTQTITRKES